MAAPRRTDFRFLDPLRVRWAEVDMQKIVFNGHYLMYVDTAVAGYWRALAMPYHDTMEALQGDLYVRKATLEYEGSARYDDRCEVGIRCGRIGTSSMVFSAAVFRGAQCLVHGELVYVFADPATQTSRPVPAALREVLTDFEAGAAMIEPTLGGWAALGEAAAGLRREVLTQEQGLQAALDGDADDANAVHVLLRNRLGQPVGAARLLARADADGAPGGGGMGRVGQVVVHQAVRGAGIGRALLNALAAQARAQGLHALQLDALAGTEGFFSRCGFAAHGAAFETAGVRHQPMVRALAR